MKIAILCRLNCSIALDTIRYFRERGKEIFLVIIETAEREQLLENERSFQKAHMEFYNYLSPLYIPENLLRYLWRIMPTNMQAMVKQTLRRIRKDRVKLMLKEMSISFVEVRRHSSMETKQLLEKKGVSHVLLTSSAWLIKEPLLSINSARIINAHCAKLPEHRSLDSLPWSVLENDTIGLTAHFVDKGIDTGPILLFIEVVPQKGDNLITLRKRVDSNKPEIFFRAIQGLQEGHIKPIEQKESEGTRHRPMTVSELIKAENVLQERLKQL